VLIRDMTDMLRCSHLMKSDPLLQRIELVFKSD